MFEALLLAGMALVLLALAGLLGKGSRTLAPGVRGEIDANPARWPRLALIVPVAGAPPALGECLRSLLYQDYPDYQVIFATRDREDPATSVIASLIWVTPPATGLLSDRVSSFRPAFAQNRLYLCLTGVEARRALHKPCASRHSLRDRCRDRLGRQFRTRPG